MKNNLRRIVVRELWALVAPVYRGSQWSKGVVPEKKNTSTPLHGIFISRRCNVNSPCQWNFIHITNFCEESDK